MWKISNSYGIAHTYCRTSLMLWFQAYLSFEFHL
uniref:Uncharacterized protein n=1 Tax=Anguilla anguilla TaxID=7936 RepID=A0A0E9UWP5_ANGAN